MAKRSAAQLSGDERAFKRAHGASAMEQQPDEEEGMAEEASWPHADALSESDNELLDGEIVRPVAHTSNRLALDSSPPAPAAAMLVTAPSFPTEHASWEAFEQRLKEYAQATYQLYVIRTTTSVKRRNQRITETGMAAMGASGLPEDEAAATSESDRVLIPESYQWYSKTLMCTHGWKNRYRGSGKRPTTAVRSTSCPAKMCVTLQRKGPGDQDWQIVITKHVRSHNHQLSKELYLYYMEHRRNYDPDLLVVGGIQSTDTMAMTPGDDLSLSLRQQSSASAGLSPLPMQHGAELARTEAGNDEDNEDADALDAVNKCACKNRKSSAPLVVRVPKMSVKVYSSWDAFHAFLYEYTLVTNQQFRTRSTVSVQSRNSKLIEHATRVGKSDDETRAQLIPEHAKWYSKMMICNHGWKRKSRSKTLRMRGDADGDEPDAMNTTTAEVCPATLLARLQRDVNDQWCVVVNRQVVEHNHCLVQHEEDHFHALNAHGGDVEEATEMQEHVHHNTDVEVSGDMTMDYNEPNASEHDDAVAATARQDLPVAASAGADKSSDVVVRVPTLTTVHESWDAFHKCLKEYSDATYQLYRTRTTSSVKGRNQKILEMRRLALNANGELTVDDQNADSRAPPSVASNSETRIIPDEWKWYSKTLTCTHGWKERRRGTGKRTVQVFRSTACPVKICATVQWVDGESVSGWRVMVTRHVVDHNHNLSKELYQHYCENRRIYDPDLLTIDDTNEAAVVASSGNQRPFAFTPTDANASVLVPSDLLSSSASGGGLHSLSLVLSPRSQQFANAMSSREESTTMDTQQESQPEPSTADLPASAIALLPYGTNFMTSQQHATQQAQSMMFANSVAHQNAAAAYGYNTSQQFMRSVDQTGVATLAAAATPVPMDMNSTDPMMMPASTQAQNRAASSVFIMPSPCPLHGSDGDAQMDRANLMCTCFRNTSSFPTAPEEPVHPATTERRALPSLAPADGSAPQRERYAVRNAEDEAMDRLDGEDAGNTIVWSPDLRVEISTITTEAGLLYRAPGIKRRHDSWDAFQDHLALYTAATYQLYRIRTTSSVSSRNARIYQQAASRAGSADPATSQLLAQLVPDSYQWYSKTFVCTHGWKERRRGKGQRVSHSLRSTGCPVKVCVTLQRDVRDLNSWHVVVTKHILEHNHEISPEIFQQYSENRRIKDPSLLVQAEELWDAGMTRRKIYEFLKEQSSNVILMKDVHNLVQRWQQRDPANGDAGGDEEDDASLSAAREPSDEHAPDPRSQQHSL